MNAEWSHWFDAEIVGSAPETVKIEAPAAAREALARRFGVDSVDSLNAELTLERVSAGAVIYVHGHFSARITQSCVVTLAPVVSTVNEGVEGWFADESQAVPFARARQDREAKKGHGEVEVLAESDDPEPIVNGRIDLGELVSQHLSLAINPYPRAEGAAYEYGEENPAQAGPARKNPFEALKDWKERR